MAYAGRTSKPCEGCGRVEEHRYGREAGKVCGECQALMEDGRRARAAAVAAAALQPERPYRWTGSFYDVEICYRAPMEARNALGKAFIALLDLVAQPAPPGTALISHQEERDGRDPFTHRKRKELVDVPWPWLLGMSKDRADRHSGYHRELQDHRLIRPDVRDALEQLRQAVNAAIDAAHQDGKERGASVLRQLAAGEITIGEYDDTLLSDAERTGRRR